MKKKKMGLHLFMAVPAFALYCVFFVYPLTKGIGMSLTNWNGYSAPEFVGLKNFVDFFHDARALHDIKTTVLFTLGSAPLYILSSWLALRFGRNAAIGVGAVGLLLAFFSIGGLAHGLMTGELTGAYPGILGYIPLTWSARLGSLGVENGMVSLSLGAHIEGSVMNVAAHVHVQTLLTAGLCLALSAAALIVLLTWFNRFEE